MTRLKKITPSIYSLHIKTASQLIWKQKCSRSVGTSSPFLWAHTSSFDDVISLVVNQCVDWLETERYLTPNEKHCLLRVMPYGLFLMDGEQNTQHNIFKSKKIKLNRFAAVFKVLVTDNVIDDVRDILWFLYMETCKLLWTRPSSVLHISMRRLGEVQAPTTRLAKFTRSLITWM